jgi:hypothetical protein
MQEALAANGDVAPEGSWDPVREPIPDAGELARSVEARMAATEADAASEGVAAGEIEAAGAAEAAGEIDAAGAAERKTGRPGAAEGDAEGA